MPIINKFFDYTQDLEDLKSVSFSVAQVIGYKFSSKSSILFKFGERERMFYFILKGRVSVLIPQEKKVYITQNEYLNYLKKLMVLEEKQILLNCLIANIKYFDYNMNKDESIFLIDDSKQSYENNFFRK